MTLRWIERRTRDRARKARRWPLLSLLVVLTAGFAWELIHLYTTLTMECEGYYAQWTDGHAVGLSLLQSVAMFVAVLAVWWLADVIRPKLYRTAILARVFEGWVIAAMLVATTINWGLLHPEGRVFPIANQVVARLAWMNGPVIWGEVQNPDGTWEILERHYDVSTLEWTDFRLVNGELQCTINRRELERYNGEDWVSPIAITEAVD